MFNDTKLDEVLGLLEGRLRRNGAKPVRLVICGGAALIATGLLIRTTRDVDVVAFLDCAGQLIPPVPWPEDLAQAARETAAHFDLPGEWLNNRPSRGEGGLAQLGLPAGIQTRLHRIRYGTHLEVNYIDRLDQIHLKLYAAVDRGGYHVSDLTALAPTEDELEHAVRWACTHDVSQAFRESARELLERLGYGTVAQRV